MASMRDWLKDPDSTKRVVVVHCKAGKGRSGTVACSYLISEEGWTVEDALARFTIRRMRSGFGNGVSIPSQLRWVEYVNWWSKHGKVYVERQIEILEVHVWGLRDGVKVAIEGYVEEGKIIKIFHTFGKHERTTMDSATKSKPIPRSQLDPTNERALPSHDSQAQASTTESVDFEPGASAVAVIFLPAQKLVLPTSDINIDFERRNKAPYGLAMVTSVAHVWFNAYFESQPSFVSSKNPPSASNATDPPVNASPLDSGVFEISWEAMDGIKGSARKGTRALDRLAVIWRAVPEPQDSMMKIITEPTVGEPIPESKPADWTKANQASTSTLGKDLGMRAENPSSANVSRASSMVDDQGQSSQNGDSPSEAGVQSHIPGDDERSSQHLQTSHPTISVSEPASLDGTSEVTGGNGPAVDLGMEKTRSPSPSAGMVRAVGMGKVAGIVDTMKAVGIKDLKTAEDHVPGQVLKDHEPVSS